MGMEIECAMLDDVKQKLLDSLSKESTMVISTAYAYAKNYVKYGEDITKEWTTAVQQASIIEKVSLNAWAQAHETFRREYETRLKADMVATLEELKKEIILQVIDEPTENGTIAEMASFNSGIVGSYDLIQQKINALKREEMEDREDDE